MTPQQCQLPKHLGFQLRDAKHVSLNMEALPTIGTQVDQLQQAACFLGLRRLEQEVHSQARLQRKILSLRWNERERKGQGKERRLTLVQKGPEDSSSLICSTDNHSVLLPELYEKPSSTFLPDRFIC